MIVISVLNILNIILPGNHIYKIAIIGNMSNDKDANLLKNFILYFILDQPFSLFDNNSDCVSDLFHQFLNQNLYLMI